MHGTDYTVWLLDFEFRRNFLTYLCRHSRKNYMKLFDALPCLMHQVVFAAVRACMRVHVREHTCVSHY